MFFFGPLSPFFTVDGLDVNVVFFLLFSYQTTQTQTFSLYMNSPWVTESTGPSQSPAESNDGRSDFPEGEI